MTSLLLASATIPLAVIVFAELRLVCADLDFVGEGIDGLIVRCAIAVVAAAVIASRAMDEERLTNRRLYRWKLGREVLMFLVVLPISILIGRIIFMYVPPW